MSRGRRGYGGGDGGGGTKKLGGLIGIGILCFVAVMFVLGIGPQLETAITATTISNTFTLAILDLLEWGIPIGLLVAALMWSIKLVRA